MARVKMYKAKSMKIGLALVAVALMLAYGVGFAGSALGPGMEVYLFVLGLSGASGFFFLVLSIFLPREKGEKPTFTQELLGKEELQ